MILTYICLQCDGKRPNSCWEMCGPKSCWTNVEQSVWYKHYTGLSRSPWHRIKNIHSESFSGRFVLKSLGLILFKVNGHIETREGVDRMNNKLDQLVECGEGNHQTITQYVGGNAYSSTQNNRVVVTGAGNSVNVSTVDLSPVSYWVQPRLPCPQPQYSSPQSHFYYWQSSYPCTQ
jgi:hypothetical protein